MYHTWLSPLPRTCARRTHPKILHGSHTATHGKAALPRNNPNLHTIAPTSENYVCDTRLCPSAPERYEMRRERRGCRVDRGRNYCTGWTSDDTQTKYIPSWYSLRHTHTHTHPEARVSQQDTRVPSDAVFEMHACGTKGHLEGGLWLYRQANLPARPTPS